jgi:hypothetical protein
VAGKGRVLLRSKNEEYLALGGTGRIGAGYGHRDGVFYALAVDDELLDLPRRCRSRAMP